MQINGYRRAKWVSLFLLSFGGMLTVILILTGLNPNYYETNKINFRTMSESDVVITGSLSDEEIARIKLDYFLVWQRPKWAMFGHHIIRGMGVKSFPDTVSRYDFFNGWFDHISLREIRNLLKQLDKNNTLPSEGLLIHISHPYVGAGMSANFRWAMPPDFYLNTSLNDGAAIFSQAKYIFGQYLSRIQQRLDWKHAAYSVIRASMSDCSKYGIRKIKSDNDAITVSMPDWIKGLSKLGLGWAVEKFSRVYKGDCEFKDVVGLKYDGSFLGDTSHITEFDAEVPVARRKSWTPKVMEEIYEIIRDIVHVGRKNNLKVIFFIPPRGQKYYAHAGHEKMDTLVKKMKQEGILVIGDHRKTNPEFFFDGRHLNNRYFNDLLNRLQSSGIMKFG